MKWVIPLSGRNAHTFLPSSCQPVCFPASNSLQVFRCPLAQCHCAALGQDMVAAASRRNGILPLLEVIFGRAEQPGRDMSHEPKHPVCPTLVHVVNLSINGRSTWLRTMTERGLSSSKPTETPCTSEATISRRDPSIHRLSSWMATTPSCTPIAQPLT